MYYSSSAIITVADIYVTTHTYLIDRGDNNSAQLSLITLHIFV